MVVAGVFMVLLSLATVHNASNAPTTDQFSVGLADESSIYRKQAKGPKLSCDAAFHFADAGFVRRDLCSTRLEKVIESVRKLAAADRRFLRAGGSQ